MTQTAELVDEPAVAPTATEPMPQRTSRLFQAAAWVAIVAGTLFIVSTVFFAGFFMGRHTGSHGHGHGGGHHSRSMPGGFGGPGMMTPWGPGMGPGQMGPGGPNTGNQAPSLSPAPPRP